jgi:putative intracellular protease/amidase
MDFFGRLTGRKTGFWLEELAAPYYAFKDAGVEVTLASPKGGRPPLDPKSNEANFRTDLTLRFEKDAVAQAQLDKTVRLDSVRQEDFDTVFYPGGHGPMWDIAEDKYSIKLIESFLAAGKTIAVVCHSQGGAFPCRRRDVEAWRYLLKEEELGSSRG